MALFFPEQWPERWWGSGDRAWLGTAVGGRRVLALAVAPGLPLSTTSFPSLALGVEGSLLI